MLALILQISHGALFFPAGPAGGHENGGDNKRNKGGE